MNHDSYLERRIPEFIGEINGTPFGKFGKPCNIRDYKNLSHFPVYFIYQFPISSESRQEMIRLSIDRRMPIYTTLSTETKDKRKIFVEMNKFIPVIKILNKKFEDYEFYILYSITPSLPANNKSIYIAVKSKSAVSFYNVKEEYNMYNDGLDVILESVYEDGYYQALVDMGYEFDDEASEDVDIFDEGYFEMDDEAMEGNPENKRKKNVYLETIGQGNRSNGRNKISDIEYRQREKQLHERHNPSLADFRDREKLLKSNAGNVRDQVKRDSINNNIKRDIETSKRVNTVQAKRFGVANAPDSTRNFVIENESHRMSQKRPVSGIRSESKIGNKIWNARKGEVSRAIHHEN